MHVFGHKPHRTDPFMYLACSRIICFSSAAEQYRGGSSIHSLSFLVMPWCSPVINTALAAIVKKKPQKNPKQTLSKKQCTFSYINGFFGMTETIYFHSFLNLSSVKSETLQFQL